MTDTKIDDGGLAFPRASGPEPRVNTATDYQEGMSLRAWFAGLAMQGLLTSGVDNVADRALYEADALIATLKEKKA